MPRGPQPKDPDERSRRNVASTAAELTIGEAKPTRSPALPLALLPWETEKDKDGNLVKRRAYHPMTRRWWRALWRSPMAPRFLEMDVEELYVLVALRDRFHKNPTPQNAAELRQQAARFGLSPIDRRRLDWRIAGPQTAPREGPLQPSKPLPPDTSRPDPRLKLLG